MPKFAFVTDSTAYIPEELLKEHNITVAPQILIWDNETFRDGVDIFPSEFYTRLKTSKTMPTTSQVPMLTMQSLFHDFVEQGFEVVGIFLSSKFSGTMQSALQAQESLGSAGEKVHLIDSRTTSMGLGFQVLETARALAAGADLKECLEKTKNAHQRTGVLFAVDTLEFLHRGGRIGGGQKFLGTMLNLKPILAIQDGSVQGIERIRTKSKAHDRVLELVTEQVKGKTNIRIAALNAHAADDAKILLDRAAKALNPVETVFTEVSPVVGTHTGPGTVGLAYIFD